MDEFLRRLGQAWEQCYGEWIALAQSFTGNRADAEDLVSDVILRTVDAHPQLDDSPSTRNYVGRAIKNHFYGQAKQRRTRRRLLQMLSKESDLFQSSFLEEVLVAKKDGERQALTRVIWDYVAKLPKQEREAIEVRFHTDDAPLSFQKVGAALSVSTGTAHARVNAALASLTVMVREGLE